MRVVVTSSVLLDAPDQSVDQIAREFRRSNEAHVGVPLRAKDGHTYTILQILRLDVVDAAPPAVYACPFCLRVSYNPHDIAQRYCGACNRFWDS